MKKFKPFSVTQIKAPWETPATKYPRVKRGQVEIRNWDQRRGIYDMYGQKGVQFYELRQPIVTTNLLIGGKVWMTDDPPHWYAMLEHARAYRGHVLCAGLGLGLIVHALDANPRVKKITVIEIERDVINLVAPLCPQRKFEFFHGDFWDDGYLTWPGMQNIDGVFYDLFVGNGHDLMPEAMRVWFQLHERFPGTVRRIHGFNNKQLQSLDSLIERM